MKIAYVFAFAAIIAITAGSMSAMGAECRACYGQPDLSTVCPTCQAPAWDRTPLCEVRAPACNTCPYTAPTIVRVDPWARCGAFCSAGQIPVGWPYGWNASYWLQPSSNF
ncbi:hypothetical protein LLG46_02010 [bacterium]|nr:hypothetical protein [bacterium]